MQWQYEAVGGGLAAGAAAIGAWQRTQWSTSQILGRTRVAAPQPRQLALTFDDGPNDRYTLEVLEALANHNARATFFMMGNYAREQPWLVREVAAAGHVIGNHTVSHPNLAYASGIRIRTELSDCSKILEDIAGQPVRYFRPPYGGRRPAVLHIARELGLEVVLWNAMGFDWRQHRRSKQVMKAVERGIRRNRNANRGSNILLHDGGSSGMGANRSCTVAATESLLERGSAAGYRFVTVEDWWPPETTSPGPGIA